MPLVLIPNLARGVEMKTAKKTFRVERMERECGVSAAPALLLLLLCAGLLTGLGYSAWNGAALPEMTALNNGPLDPVAGKFLPTFKKIRKVN